LEAVSWSSLSLSWVEERSAWVLFNLL
jgi:hypothetical protein